MGAFKTVDKLRAENELKAVDKLRAENELKAVVECAEPAAVNKALIAQQFGRSARSYDCVADMQRQIALELISIDELPPQPLVDLGCGTGYALSVFAQLGLSDLAGLDLASEMLSEAALKVPSAVLEQGDIEALPYPDQTFSTVFSSSAVQWCDLPLVLSEIYRVSERGGRLLLSSFVRGTLQSWRDLWQLSDTERFISVSDFKAAITVSGFIEPRFWTKSYLQRFSSFESAVNSIRDLGAGHNGREQRRGLMGRRQYADIRAGVERIIDQQGFIELAYEVVFVSARKPGVVDG